MRNFDEVEKNLVIFDINGKKSVYNGINATILRKLFCNEKDLFTSIGLNIEEFQCDKELITFIEIVTKFDTGSTIKTVRNRILP